MADVLEHIPFPKMALAAAHRLLQQDGVLFLSMRNMDSMVWRLLHRNGANPYWGEIEHYHNFSRRRLYALLRVPACRIQCQRTLPCRHGGNRGQRELKAAGTINADGRISMSLGEHTLSCE
jgi:Methyltransferase domain